MGMSNYKCILFCVLILTTVTGKAEEVQIESIKSTEGAGIECSATMSGNLTLDIFGEIGKRSFSVVKKDKYIYLIDKESRYSQPIYEDSKNIFCVLENSRSMYFLDGEPIRGTLGDEELAKSKISYKIVKDALHEAHLKGKCLNWKL